MINARDFYEELNNNGVSNFAGVPDSLLKSFCAYVSDTVSGTKHTVTANEGSAIALATGQYLSSKKPSLVYMQNSGFGNALNPLLSLADPDVFSIPMILLMGWRGEPGSPDEPQHMTQGRIMEPLLNACGTPYFILDSNEGNLKKLVAQACQTAMEQLRPVGILVRKGTFSNYEPKDNRHHFSLISRELAISEIVSHLGSNSIFVSTTGYASRELFEIREKFNQQHSRDFLTVGSMGHASMIATGIAQNSSKQVVCLDGDGAALMHLGNMAGVAQSGAENLLHILLNNSAHDSVGGQPTCGINVDFKALAESNGYQTAKSCCTLPEIPKHLNEIIDVKGPHFIEVKVRRGCRSDLGRPHTKPCDNKVALMSALGA